MASSFTASQQAGAGQASSANTIVAAWFGGKRFSEGYSREYTWPELAAALAAPHLITPADAAEYKDGPCMVFAKLRQRPTGFCVGRKKTDPLARTALAFDIETNKTTGEVPPAFDQMVERIKTLGWSAALYSSFSHTPELPRYRIAVPMTHPIDPALPAIEVVAEHLGIAGVFDTSKCGAHSVFFMPRAPKVREAYCRSQIVAGERVCADLVVAWASRLQAERDASAAEQQRARAERKEQRRRDLEAQGIDPDWSLIDQIRGALMLAGVDIASKLAEHGYEMDDRGDYRHPASRER